MINYDRGPERPVACRQIVKSSHMGTVTQNGTYARIIDNRITIGRECPPPQLPKKGCHLLVQCLGCIFSIYESSFRLMDSLDVRIENNDSWGKFHYSFSQKIFIVQLGRLKFLRGREQLILLDYTRT